ncbi:MAG: ATP-binding cassette domain-containing protein [Deltaproteobacteria bacterium]|nr:ATP-binding cassette domain-containing protein [Deltaproteobacteria bacterium]
MLNLLEIKNATVYRGIHEVFHNLSLALPQGCNTAILGPNGAGKSTLLKLLARDLYPVQREDSYIRLFGQERWDVWELRAHFGIVSHELQQQYLSTARGVNVILSGYYSSVDLPWHQHPSEDDRDRAQQVMRTLGITGLSNRIFGEMSTGEQRRFLLGRALVNNPDTLVLDEPTSGLDINACFQYLDTIRGLMQKGKTVILVTHHIHEIPPEIEQIVLIKSGKILAHDQKERLLTDERLSQLFDTPVKLLQHNGFYQALPGTV